MDNSESQLLFLWHTMKMTPGLLALGLLFLCGVSLIFACRYQRTSAKSPVEQSIADLRSEDFHSSRKAQLGIISAGKSVLPRLSEVIRTSDNPQQVALGCYLIGEIDSGAYKSVLVEFGVPGKLCTILRYPNLEAIKKLPENQREELSSHFSKLAAGASKDETDCIQKLTQAIKEK